MSCKCNNDCTNISIPTAAIQPVTIQYSINGTTAWHSTYALGVDFYMRVRVGTGAWSLPMRFVGPIEDGIYESMLTPVTNSTGGTLEALHTVTLNTGLLKNNGDEIRARARYNIKVTNGVPVTIWDEFHISAWINSNGVNVFNEEFFIQGLATTNYDLVTEDVIIKRISATSIFVSEYHKYFVDSSGVGTGPWIPTFWEEEEHATVTVSDLSVFPLELMAVVDVTKVNSTTLVEYVTEYKTMII